MNDALRSVQYIIFAASVSVLDYIWCSLSALHAACAHLAPSVSLAAQFSIHSIRWQKCRTYPTLLITALRISAIIAPHPSVHWLYLSTAE